MPTPQSLSTQTKKQADLLLKDSGLIKFLSEFGKVAIHGSYELDLMMDSDIDINVVNENFTKEQVVKILNKLILENYFKGYFFYDFVARRRKDFPPGYYIGLKLKFKNRKWKIDIWFLNKPYKINERTAEFVKKNLTEKSRKTILKLKQACLENNLKISGYFIYMAVLKEDISSLEELKKYIVDFE